MNLETKITIYKFTPQLFTLTHDLLINPKCEFIQSASLGILHSFFLFIIK